MAGKINCDLWLIRSLKIGRGVEGLCKTLEFVGEFVVLVIPLDFSTLLAKMFFILNLEIAVV